MKSLFTKGALALCMAASVSATEAITVPTAVKADDAVHQTIMKNMQDKVAQDIKSIIAQYDYKKAYEQAQIEFKLAEEAKAALQKVKSLDEASAEDLIKALIAKLQKMRNEAGNAKPEETFFPAATEAEGKYLDHLNVKIDLHDHGADSVTIATAAQDAHGAPLMLKSFSNNKVETIVPAAIAQPAPVAAKIDVAQAVKAKMEEMVVPAAAVVAPAATTTIVAKSAETQLDKAAKTLAKRQAALAEARDVAFQVVFFFIALIFASFGLLYIYHKMEQERAQQAAGKANQQRKETFFEFLAGNLEEDYPQRANGTATKYQV